MAKSLEYSIQLIAQTKGITKGLKEARKDVAKAAKGMTGDQKKQAAKISKIKKDLLAHEDKIIQDSVKQQEALMRKRLQNVKKNSKKEYEIKKKFLEKIGGLHKQLITDQMKMETKAVGTGKMSGGFDETEKSTSKLGAGIDKLTRRISPLGAAFGIVTAGAVGLSAAAKKATDSFVTFNNKIQRLHQTTSLTSKEIKTIGVELLGISRPAHLTAESIADIALSVATFEENAANIPKITEQITKLAMAFPDVDPKEVTDSMVRLTEQLGDADKAFENLAAISIITEGVGGELSTIFAQAAVAVGDVDAAMERSIQVYDAYMTAGLDMSQATTEAEIVFKELASRVKDTSAMTNYSKILEGTGKTLKDVGLELGNVDPGKLADFFAEGSPAADKLSTALGTTGDKIQVLSSSLSITGGTMKDFIADTENMTEKIDGMRTAGQKATDDLTQNFDNLMINVGSSASVVVSGATQVIADVLGGVASLFEPAERTFDRAIASAQGFNDTIEDLNFILDNPSPNTEKQLGFINDQLDSIAEVEPFVAEEIEKIQNNESLGTSEQLEQINALLEGTITLAEGLRDVQAFDAMAAAADMMGESLWESVSAAGSTATVLDEVGKNLATGGLAFLGEQLGVIERDATVSQAAIADAFSEVDKMLPKTRDELTKLRDEYKSLPAGSQEQVDKLKEMSAASTKLNDLTKRRKIQQDAITKSAETTLEAQIQLNDASVEGLDVQDVYLTALAQAPEPLQRSLEFQTQLKEEVEKQFNAVVDTNKAEESLVDTIIKELQTQGKITFANDATKDEKLEILKATREQLVLEERLLAIEIDKAQKVGMEAGAIEAMVANQTALVESIAAVDESIAGLAENTAVAVEETKQLDEAMEKVRAETAKIVQSTKDIKFDASIAGLEGAGKDLAKLEYEYKKMLESLPPELKNNQEHMEALWENHQAKVGAIQKRATEEREAEALKVAEDAAKKREDAHKAAMAERERLAKEAAEREKQREAEMAEAEAERNRRAEEALKRRAALQSELLGMHVSSVGQVGALGDRLKIIMDTIGQVKIAKKAGNTMQATEFITKAVARLEQMSLAPIIGDVEALGSNIDVAGNAFNLLLEHITDEDIKAAFAGFDVGLTDIKATIEDIPFDIFLETQDKIINSVEVTNKELRMSEESIKESIRLTEEEIKVTEIGLKHAVNTNAESLEALEMGEELLIEKLKLVALENQLAKNAIRSIDMAEDSESLAIRQNALLDKSIDKERELEQLAIVKNEARILELQNLEQSEAVQRQIVELEEINIGLIAKEEERKQLLAEQLLLIEERRRALSDEQKEILDTIKIRNNAYKQELKQIHDAAKDRAKAHKKNLDDILENIRLRGGDAAAEVAARERFNQIRLESEAQTVEDIKALNIEATKDALSAASDQISSFGSIATTAFGLIKGAIDGTIDSTQVWFDGLSDIVSEFGAIGGVIGGALSLFDELILLLDDSDEKEAERIERNRVFIDTIKSANENLKVQLEIYDQLVNINISFLDSADEQLKRLREIKDAYAEIAFTKGFKIDGEAVYLIEADLNELLEFRKIAQDNLNKAIEKGTTLAADHDRLQIEEIEAMIDLTLRLIELEKDRFQGQLNMIDIANELGVTETRALELKIRKTKEMIDAQSELTGEFLFSAEERAQFQADILNMERQLIDEREKEALLFLELQGIEKGSLEFMETRLGFLMEQIKRSKELGITGTDLLELLVERKNLEEDITEEMEKQTDSLSGMKALQDKLAALDHEHAMDRIDDEQYLEDKLKLLNEMWALSIETNAPIEEQRKLELAIHNLLEDQNRLKEDSLGLDDKSLKKLSELVRKRQKVIEQFRAGQVGAEAVEETNQRIRAELVTQGMSESEIAQFMATLPTRHEGGPTEAGAYMLDDDEYIQSSKAVAKYGAGFMERLNNLQVPVPESPALRHLTGAAMQNNSAQSIVINVQVANDWEINGNADAAEQIASQQKEFLYEAINQGIKSRRINLISGGRL